jgi:hypothetical protein
MNSIYLHLPEGRFCATMSIPRGEAMGWTTVKKIFAESGQLLNQELEVRGWIRTQRESKNFTFIELND